MAEKAEADGGAIIPAKLLHDLQDGACQRLDTPRGSLVVLRRNGILHCYLNRCPHRGTELDWAPGAFFDPGGRWLQCATHGALFDPETGMCIEGPCRGQSLQRVPVPEE